MKILRVLFLSAWLVSGAPLFAQQPPAVPPPVGAPPASGGEAAERTPPRVSLIQGQVSFWRPGTEDWAPASLNLPLAPGDALYAGRGATAEVEIGPRALVRAGEDTELGLENQERDFLQLEVKTGHTSLDVRTIHPGETIEVDTPNAAFRIETTGYYRLDVADDRSTFVTRRGGRATMTPESGAASAIVPSEEVVVQGSGSPTVETYVAPEMDAWDRWNSDRTDHLVDPVSERYVPPDVYGVDELDHYGSWRVVPEYGPVWIPSGVGADWAPYSTGSWIWDPSYGWTWVDRAPWGWAPYHYGRWVFVDDFWAWAPGPLVAAPVYSPALVTFVGGPPLAAAVGIGGPVVGWVALGWGEPLFPWWGPPGFLGVAWWGGWGGPRVEHFETCRNAGVRHAVIAVPQDRFGRAHGNFLRAREVDARQLEIARGRLPVHPEPASLTPTEGHGLRPPRGVSERSVVATHAPADHAASLRAAGIQAPPRRAPESRIVSPPSGLHAALTAPRPPFGQHGFRERQPPPPPPMYGRSRPLPRPPAYSRNLPGEPANRLDGVPGVFHAQGRRVQPRS